MKAKKTYTQYEDACYMYSQLIPQEIEKHYHLYRNTWRGYSSFADYMINVNGVYPVGTGYEMDNVINGRVA